MTDGFEKVADLIKNQPKSECEINLAKIKSVSPLSVEISGLEYNQKGFNFVKPFKEMFKVGDLYSCAIQGTNIFLLGKSEVVK